MRVDRAELAVDSSREEEQVDGSDVNGSISGPKPTSMAQDGAAVMDRVDDKPSTVGSDENFAAIDGVGSGRIHPFEVQGAEDEVYGAEGARHQTRTNSMAKERLHFDGRGDQVDIDANGDDDELFESRKPMHITSEDPDDLSDLGLLSFFKKFRHKISTYSPAKRLVIYSVSFVFLVILLILIIRFVTPFFLGKVIYPLQTAIRTSTSPLTMSLVCVAGIVIFPLVMIPAGPFIWMAAVSLGLWKGFWVVQIGTALGMTSSFVLGGMLQKRCKRHVEDKDWVKLLLIAVRDAGPFKVVLLMRLGPAPYALLNYTCRLSPDIGFLPYITASVIGRSLHNCIDIYVSSGVSTAGDAIGGELLDKRLILFYVLGFVSTIAISVCGLIYAKRSLEDLKARSLVRDQVWKAFTLTDEESALLGPPTADADGGGGAAADDYDDVSRPPSISTDVTISPPPDEEAPPPPPKPAAAAVAPAAERTPAAVVANS